MEHSCLGPCRTPVTAVPAPAHWPRTRASGRLLAGHPCLPRTLRCRGCLQQQIPHNCRAPHPLAATWLRAHCNPAQRRRRCRASLPVLTKLLLQLFNAGCGCCCCPQRLQRPHSDSLATSHPARRKINSQLGWACCAPADRRQRYQCRTVRQNSPKGSRPGCAPGGLHLAVICLFHKLFCREGRVWWAAQVRREVWRAEA